MTIRFSLEEVQQIVSEHAKTLFLGQYAPSGDESIGCSAYDNAGEDLDGDTYFECFVG